MSALVGWVNVLWSRTGGQGTGIGGGGMASLMEGGLLTTVATWSLPVGF